MILWGVKISLKSFQCCYMKGASVPGITQTPLSWGAHWHRSSSHSLECLSWLTFSHSPGSHTAQQWLLCLQDLQVLLGLAYIAWDQRCALRILLSLAQSDVSSPASGVSFSLLRTEGWNPSICVCHRAHVGSRTSDQGIFGFKAARLKAGL